MHKRAVLNKFYVELIHINPPNFDVFWLWREFFFNSWMHETAVLNNFYVEVTLGFTMIGWPRGEHRHPRGRPYYLKRVKPVSRKRLMVWLKNASLGKTLAVGSDLNILNNTILIVKCELRMIQVIPNCVINVFLTGIFCNLPCECQPHRL